MTDLMRHERNVKAGLNAMFSKQLESYQADVYQGAAAFLDPHTVRLTAQPEGQRVHPLASADGDVRLRGEQFLIATGSSPVRPPMFPVRVGGLRLGHDTRSGPAAEDNGGGRRRRDRQRVRLHVRRPGRTGPRH